VNELEDQGAQGGSERRVRILLWVVIAAYVGAIVGLALAGRFTFVVKTAIVPVLVVFAAATGRAREFARDWTPFLGVVLLFDSFRGLVFALINVLDLPVYAAYAIRADRFVLGGTTLPNKLQAAWYDPQSLNAVDIVAVVAHASHFLAFLLFGLVIWAMRRAAFRRYTLAVTVLLGSGVLLYALIPTVPPWMAWQEFRLIPPIHHLSTEVYNTSAPVLNRTFSTNPIAAMPSLHAALPALCALVGWHEFRWRGGAPLAAFALLMWMSIGYLGEHYLVDIVAGAALALVVYVAIYRWPWGSAATGRRPGRVGFWIGRHPILAGALLAVSAEAIGQVAVLGRGDGIANDMFVPNETFVRELLAGNDVANVHRARAAIRAGEYEQAEALLNRTIRDAVFGITRVQGVNELARLAIASRDARVLLRSLEALEPAQRGPRGDVFLAWAKLRTGETSAIATLDRLQNGSSNTAMPAYVSTLYRLDAGAMSAADGEARASQLEAMDGRERYVARWYAEQIRGALSRYAEGAAVSGWDCLELMVE
jgi:membrane-associated phospholipid phosphatase